MLMRSFLCLALISVAFGAGVVLDLSNGTTSSSPDYLTVYNGSLFFRAAADGSSANLWSTPGGIQAEVWQMPDATYGFFPAYLTPFMDDLVMNADDGQGSQLWVFDPNSEPWFLKIYLSSQGSVNPGQPDGFLERDGKLFFAASQVDSDVPQPWTVLYTFDGSQVNQISTSTNPRFATSFQGKVYFSANGGPTIGQELHVWDELNGEVRVTDFNGAAGSFPSFFTVFQGKLFFSLTVDGFGSELASYDGTNVVLEADINPGSGSSNPANLIVFNDVLYFSAMGDTTTGVELWCYDGMEAKLVEDINPMGSSLRYPAHVAVAWNLLLFSADDGTHGFELWAHDGNTTWMLADLNEGSDSSDPADFTIFADDVYFVATTAEAGRELIISNGIIPNPNTNNTNNTNNNNNTNSTETCYNVNTECQLDDECCTGYCDLGGPMPAKAPKHSPPKKVRPVMENHTETGDDDDEDDGYGKRRGLPDPKNPGKTSENSTYSPSTYAPSTNAPSTNAPSTNAPATYAPSTEAPPTNETTTEPKTPPNTLPPKTPEPSSKGKVVREGNWSYRCMCRPEAMECSSGVQCCSGSCVQWDGKSGKMSRGSKGTKHTLSTKDTKGTKGTNSSGDDDEVVWVCAPTPKAKASKKDLGKSVGVGVGVGVGCGALITIGVLTRRSILKRRREAEAQAEEGATEVAMTESTVPAFKFVPTADRVDA